MRDVVCAIGALMLVGCSGNSLQGSLEMDVTSLAFSSIVIEETSSTSGTEVAVQYEDELDAGTGNNIVLSIIVNISDLNLTHGGTIDLTQTLPDGTPRGQFSRSVSDDSRTFPPIVHGSISFDQDPVLNAKVSGSFDVLWGQGGQLGNGETAYGNFSGVVTTPGD